eukprot:6196743-Pleurochrysis_carterae.AAC.2
MLEWRKTQRGAGGAKDYKSVRIRKGQGEPDGKNTKGCEARTVTSTYYQHARIALRDVARKL